MSSFDVCNALTISFGRFSFYEYRCLGQGSTKFRPWFFCFFFVLFFFQLEILNSFVCIFTCWNEIRTKNAPRNRYSFRVFVSCSFGFCHTHTHTHTHFTWMERFGKSFWLPRIDAYAIANFEFWHRCENHIKWPPIRIKSKSINQNQIKRLYSGCLARHSDPFNFVQLMRCLTLAPTL